MRGALILVGFSRARHIRKKLPSTAHSGSKPSARLSEAINPGPPGKHWLTRTQHRYSRRRRDRVTDFVIVYTVLSFHCTVQLHHISLHLKQASTSTLCGYLSVSLPATLNSSTSPRTLLSLSIRAEEETACWGYITICIALLSFCSPGKVLDILIQAFLQQYLLS